MSDTQSEYLPTDDGSLIEMYSDTKVVITEGDENNIKITTVNTYNNVKSIDIPKEVTDSAN